MDAQKSIDLYLIADYRVLHVVHAIQGLNMTSIRLPLPLEERLNFLAQATGRTKSFYIREALEKCIEDMEDIYLSQQVLERIRAGQEKTYTLEEAAKILGLED